MKKGMVNLKKTLKKLCSLVVALTMIVSMTVCVASAADTSFDAYKEYLNECADVLWQDSFNATIKGDIASLTESNYANNFGYSVLLENGCASYEAWAAAGGEIALPDGSAAVGGGSAPAGDPPGEPPAGDPPADAPAEPAPEAPVGATIESVEFGPAYLPSTATEDDTINSTSASTNIVKVTLSDGTVYEAAEGNVYTLVVDGVQYDILDYVEDKTVLAGDWALYETSDEYQYSEFAKFMNMAGNTAQYTYRAALTVMDGEIVAAQSIPALTATATVSGTELAGGSITSMGAFFNGVIVGGNTEYTIKGTEFTFIGDGANDFQGEAAAVLSEDNASVTLDGVYINTAGVIRTGAAVKENGKLYIKNSVIFTEESQDTKAEYDALVVPMMKRTPFALGLEGVVRATNVLGSGQGIYSDSIIVSTGWGALSTDSGKGGVEALNVTNVLGGIGDVEVAVEGKEYTATKEVNGVLYGYTLSGSGYVAYADAGVIDIFNNVEFYSPQYVQIMASSTSSAHYTNSKLTSGAVAVMTQQNNGGTIEIKDSTVDVADTVVQIKSGKANIGYTNVILDNATVTFTEDNAWGGILIELVESDDAGNPGNTSFTIEDLGDTVGIEAASTKGIIADSNATLKNGTYVGDIYNNIYNGFQALNVTLENADLTGTVSSSYGYHVDDNGVRYTNGTVLTAANSGDYRVDPESGDFIKIGAQVNVVEAVDANPINLTIGADSTWTVGEVNYLNTLTVANADVLKGEGTVYTSELTVAGEKLADGTYTYGTVTVIVDYNEEMAEWLVGASDTGVLAESQDYAGNAFTIKVVDQDGNNASRYLSNENTVKMNADGTVSFSVVVLDEFASYVTLKEITATDDITLHACTQGVYEHGFTVTPSEEPAAGGDMGGMPGMPGMPGGDMGGMPGMPGGDMGGMPGMPGMGAAAASATVTITLNVAEAPAEPEQPAPGGDMPPEGMPPEGMPPEGMPPEGMEGEMPAMGPMAEAVALDATTVQLTFNGNAEMDTYSYTVTGATPASGTAVGGEVVTLTVSAPGVVNIHVDFTAAGGPFVGQSLDLAVEVAGQAPVQPEPPVEPEQPVQPEPPVAESETYTVVEGDSLWNISQKLFGTGYKWSQIFEANRGTIKNENLIFVGQVLIIPGL